MNTFAVETDTKLAEAHDRLAKAAQKREWIASTLRRNAGQQSRRGVWTGTLADAISFHLTTDKGWFLQDFDQYKAAVQAHEVEAVVVEHLNSLYTGWSRFFLVTNTNGHVHSSMSCSTCFSTTTFGWLPQLSGLTEVEAVADQGEILCSICFPSAPVAWTTGVSRASVEARDARAAKSAALAAKKAEKALGTVLRVGRWNDRIETIAAAKKFLTDQAEYPQYTADETALVAETLATRLGTTVAEELAAAAKRAEKRNR